MRRTHLAALLALSALACHPPLPRLVPREQHLPPADESKVLVVGDTQRTLWTERLACREQNEAERRSLAEMMATEGRVAYLVHLGDLVSYGESDAEWRYFRHLMSPVTSKGTDILPVVGNHDCWGETTAAARRRLRREFPLLQGGTRYSKVHRGLALVVLDTNLEGPAAERQTRWFRRKLRAYDDSNEVRAIIVFTHHPPYTNGEHREDDPYVRHEIVPPFEESTKAVALLSGHVHGYERFTFDGKHYVVTGGGGGPRVGYRTGTSATACATYAPDQHAGEPRPLNYVVIRDQGSSLTFTVRCLPGHPLCSRGKLDEFAVALPPARTATRRTASTARGPGSDPACRATPELPDAGAGP